MSRKRKLKIWANLILLLFAIFFLGLAAEVRYASKSVDWVGSRIVKAYSWVHKHQMEDALNQIAEGNPKISINLLHSWEDIKKGDRAYPFKRTILVKLTEYLHSQERFNELLEWTEKWKGLDDRDITGLAYYYEALKLSNDRSLEGEAGLHDQFYKFPKNPALQRFYFPLTTKYGDQQEFENLTQTPASNWQVFWSNGNAFSSEEVKTIKPTQLGSDRWEIEVVVTEPVVRWRLDPPSNYLLRISELTMLKEGAACPIPIESMKLHDMILAQDGIIASGGNDPYVAFRSNICNTGDDKQAGRVRFQFTAILHSSAKRTAQDGDQQEFENLTQTPASNWQVFWSNGNAFSSEEVKTIKPTQLGSDRWEIEVVVTEPVVRWRLDPPSNYLLRISELTMLKEGAACPIPIESMKLHNLILVQDGIITSGGNDPHVSFPSNICNTEDDKQAGRVRFQFTAVRHPPAEGTAQ